MLTHNLLNNISIEQARYLPGTVGLYDQPGNRFNVAIIGGGPAGAAAAFNLNRLGHHPIIIEQNNELGGRLKSLAVGINQTIEGGGMRIPETHLLVNHYVALASLHGKRKPFINESPQAFLKNRGHTVKRTEQKALAAALDVPYHYNGMTPVDYVSASLHEVVSTLGGDQGIHQVEQQLVKGHHYGFVSLRHFFQAKGRSDPEIEFLTFVSGIDAYLDSPVGEAAVDYHSLYLNPGYYTLEGGLQQLPQRLIDMSQAQVQLNSRVTKINVQTHGVIIAMNTPEGDQELAVDYVIVTCPPPTVNHMQFDPPLPVAQAKAMESVQYAKSSKTIIECTHPFWLDEGIQGGASFTDDVLQQVYYPSDAEPGKPCAFTASYTWEDKARRVQNMSDAERNERIYRALEELHPGCRQYFRSIRHFDWDKLLGYGAFAYYKSGDYANHHQLLSQPFPEATPRVFFASEAGSLHHGWTEGALASSQGAVMQLLSSLR